MVKLPSVFVLVQRILNYYPNYATHRSYFGEVKTPWNAFHKLDQKILNLLNRKIKLNLIKQNLLLPSAWLVIATVAFLKISSEN